MFYLSCVLIGMVVGIVYFSRSTIKNLKKELSDSKELFKITYDLLWMEVREKNDLTYEQTALLLKSMQMTPDYLGKVKETLALRIVGQSKKKVGF